MTCEHRYCPTCSGTGEGPYDGARCMACRGTGDAGDRDRRERIAEDYAEIAAGYDDDPLTRLLLAEILRDD